MRSKLFVVDAMALLFRSFYAMSRARLTAPDGTPTGAVYGFFRVLVKILREQNPTHLVIAWDMPAKNFRHELYDLYKANRKETPEDIKVQIPLLREVCDAFGICSLGATGFEGDDVVGTVAKWFENTGDVYIISGDKDFMQLINNNIKMISLKSGDEYEILQRENVIDYFGVPPEQVVDVLALRGDSVDNVPGVAGIGVKKSSDLIGKYGSLNELYNRIDEVADKKQKNALLENRAMALLSQQLVTINTQVPLDLQEQNMQYGFARFCSSQCGRERLASLNMHSLAKMLSETSAVSNNAVNNISNNIPNKVPAKVNERKIITSIFDYSDEPSEIVEDNKEAQKIEQLKRWGKRNYQLVNTKVQLQELCKSIASPDLKFFAFDTETTGLDILQDKPIGASFSFGIDTGFYVPIHNNHLQLAKAEFSSSEVIASLSQAFISRTAIAVAHNLKFDSHMLANLNLSLGNAPLACSMVAAWLGNPIEDSFGLDGLTLKYLDLYKIPTSNLIGKKSECASMLDVSISTLVEYACEDVDAVYRLWPMFLEQLSKNNLLQLFWDLEMPILAVLLDMERAGVFIDAKMLNALGLEAKDAMLMLENQIFEHAGCTFNISSPKQLGQILFEKLKVHEALNYKGKLAKTTLGYKTDAAVLSQFMEHPVVSLISDFRELSKLVGTYIDALPKLINPISGRLHTSYHQIGTATGRLSSSNPNLQNIPVRTVLGKKVRKAFAAESENNIITCSDYSQIELRILAHLANDPGMKQAFANNVDIHRETAARIHGKSLESVSAAERSGAKAINFGLIYGMGAQRLAKGQEISMAEAKKFIDKYFENFPAIRQYMDTQRAFAKEYGFVKTLSGRIRPIPEIKSPNNMVARSAENVAINSPVQGTAADLMKFGMLNVWRALKQGGYKTRLLLQVHDEILLEGPKSEADAVRALVKFELERAMPLSVPMVAEVGQASNWLDAKN